MCKNLFKKGEEIDYHGRSGKIIDFDGDDPIIFFADTAEEEFIEYEELLVQNNKEGE